MYDNPKGSTTLITACPVVDELSLEFIRFLSRGPFRAFQDKISLEPGPLGTFYIKCSDLDKWPANVLYNFCIATRVPIEHQTILLKWEAMLKKDVNENVAWALAPYYYTGADKPISASPTWLINHYHTDPQSNIQNIINGTFDNGAVSEKSFFKNPHQTTPTNCIWGLSDEEERQLIRGKTPLEICDVFGLIKPEVTGVETAQENEQKFKAALQALKIQDNMWKPAFLAHVDAGQHLVVKNLNFVAQAQNAINIVQGQPVAHFVDLNFHDDLVDIGEDPNGWEDDGEDELGGEDVADWEDGEDELDDDF